MLSVPDEDPLPGAMVPPLATLTAELSALPVPPKVPPLTEIAPLPLLVPFKRSRPSTTAVPPVWVLIPVRVSVPLPCLTMVPAPLIAPAYAPLPVWLKMTSVLEAAVMSPCRLVEFPASAPPSTRVPPVWVLVPARVRVPAPSLRNRPVPLIDPA